MTCSQSHLKIMFFFKSRRLTVTLAERHIGSLQNSTGIRVTCSQKAYRLGYQTAKLTTDHASF